MSRLTDCVSIPATCFRPSTGTVFLLRSTAPGIEARKAANNISDTREKAIAYCNEVKEKFFDHIRYHVDKLELLVDDREWYLPKYREILFLR